MAKYIMYCSNIQSLYTAMTMNLKAYQVTEFMSTKCVVRITRRVYKNKKTGKKRMSYEKFEFVVTIGPPNYAERQTIKKTLNAGEVVAHLPRQFKYIK